MRHGWGSRSRDADAGRGRITRALLAELRTLSFIWKAMETQGNFLSR